MKSANELSREIEALRACVARLGTPMRHRDVQVGNRPTRAMMSAHAFG